MSPAELAAVARDLFRDAERLHRWADNDATNQEHEVRKVAARIKAKAALRLIGSARTDLHVAELERKLAAAVRLHRNDYIDWSEAGGGDECPHGFNRAAFDCPECDEELIASAGIPAKWTLSRAADTQPDKDPAP